MKKTYRYRKVKEKLFLYYDLLDDIIEINYEKRTTYYQIDTNKNKNEFHYFSTYKDADYHQPEQDIVYIIESKISYESFKTNPKLAIEILDNEYKERKKNKI